MRVAYRFALARQKFHFLKLSRNSVQFDNVYNVDLISQPCQSELEFTVLVDTSLTERHLSTTGCKAATKAPQRVIKQVGAVVGCQLLLAFQLRSESALRVSVTFAISWATERRMKVELSNHGPLFDKGLVACGEEGVATQNRDYQTTLIWKEICEALAVVDRLRWVWPNL